MIHVNGRRGNSIALALRLGVPGFRYVTTVHGVLGLHSRRNAIYRVVDQAAGRFAKTVIAVSEHGRKALVQTGSPGRKTIAITNGLAARDLRELRDVAAVRQSGAPDRSVVRLGFLGRLSPEKGTRELLDVARLIAGSDLRATIQIAGDGPDRDWMTAASAAMTDAGFITWHGAITDVLGFLKDVDVLIVPSHNEGLPYALLESMAAGCAVVAFAVGGIPEAIGDSSTGVLIEPGDVEGLTAAVVRLAADPKTISALGAAASTRVELHFALATRLPAIWRAYGLATDSGVAIRDGSAQILSE
jgi:glycosyltransferase involved in cell wall biosynthesis